DLKNQPGGWETTSKGEEDGNIWEISQRDKDILVQEYERRIAFNKFQVWSWLCKPVGGYPLFVAAYLVEIEGRTVYSSIKSSSTIATCLRCLSTKATGGRDEWNDAWETAWLPEDLSAKNRAPWETDVNFSISDTPPKEEEVLDPDTKAFVEDMADNWEQRRKKAGTSKSKREQEERLMKLKEDGKSLYSLENVKRDYRVMKQRVHAGLWVKEIEKMEEAKLGGSADDLDRFLDTASEIFESGSNS
nr:mucin-related protein [Tanacetum cinerariifolium]